MAKFLDYTGLQHLTTWMKNTFLQKNALPINEIKRNGTVINPTDKSVDIDVPVRVSQLTNDSEFQTKAQVNALLNNMQKIKKSVVETLPDTGEENIIYLVSNSKDGNNIYDEFLWINGKYEKIGDTSTTINIESITNQEIDLMLS